jgi:hypothetical protein
MQCRCSRKLRLLLTCTWIQYRRSRNLLTTFSLRAHDAVPFLEIFTSFQIRARECSAGVFENSPSPAYVHMNSISSFSKLINHLQSTSTWMQYNCPRNLQPPSVYVHMNAVQLYPVYGHVNAVQLFSIRSPASCLRAHEHSIVVLETCNHLLSTSTWIQYNCHRNLC